MAKKRKGSDIIPRKKLATRKKGNFKPRLELLHSIAKHTLYMCMCILLQPDYSLRSFSQAPKTNCGLSDDYETNFVHNYSDLTDFDRLLYKALNKVDFFLLVLANELPA